MKLTVVERKEYKRNNRDKINTNEKRRLKEDPFYKIKRATRDCIKCAFRRKTFTKNSKTAEVLGCTYEEFAKYIESKFESWMNWNNYGNWSGYPKEVGIAWELDHVIPISSAQTEEEVIKLNHYTNFQPMCSYTNRYIKRNKY